MRKPLAEKPVVVIAGPTASGKSALALELAPELHAEILCCDSITVFKRLEIGSAKPTPEERSLVPHHLVDLVEPWESFTAGDFVRHAARVIEELHARQKVPLLVGGAGFYLRALLRGMASAEDEDPARAKEIRARLEAHAQTEGFPALHKELLGKDPGSAPVIHENDHYRILRALQAMELYGRPWSELNRAARAAPPRYPGLRYFCLDLDREVLRERVEKRTRAMLEQGLLEEVEALLRDPRLTPSAKPLQSVGYKECVDVCLGKLPRADLEGKIVQETMRLAKSQRTWFRGEGALVEWIAPEIGKFREALVLE